MERGGGINWEFGINRYTLPCIKQINKGLLYTTGNYIHYLIVTYNRKESVCAYLCVYIYIYIYTYTFKTKSLCCTPESNAIL